MLPCHFYNLQCCVLCETIIGILLSFDKKDLKGDTLCQEISLHVYNLHIDTTIRMKYPDVIFIKQSMQQPRNPLRKLHPTHP